MNNDSFLKFLKDDVFEWILTICSDVPVFEARLLLLYTFDIVSACTKYLKDLEIWKYIHVTSDIGTLEVYVIQGELLRNLPRTTP